MLSTTIQLLLALMILSLPAWAEHGNTLGAASTGEKARSEITSAQQSYKAAVDKISADTQKAFSPSSSADPYSSVLNDLSSGKYGVSSSGAASPNTTSNDIAEAYKRNSDLQVAGMRAQTEYLLQSVDAAIAAQPEATTPRSNREKMLAAARGGKGATDPMGIVMQAIDEKNASAPAPALGGGAASAGSSADHQAKQEVVRTSGTSALRGISSVTQGMEKAYNVPAETFR